ncbi:MAG: hypothetical protein GVY25_01115 [Bacteroidetes bacterium]|jgi:pimeloyl-ACP methyl ester carboxylesterase|nr:hypothetical protein [Bacteroidota bacterium]
MFTNILRISLFAMGLTLFLGSYTDVFGQRNVTFVHGLNGSSSSFAFTDNKLSTEYDISTRRISYSSDLPISTIAQNESSGILSNSVVVAHSMGGIVSREMIRQGRGGRIDALITTGTPHLGAVIANTVNNGVAQYALALTAADVTVGWARACVVESWIPTACNSLAEQIFQSLLRTGPLGVLIDSVEPYSDLRSTADLEVDSGFMTTLNNNPSSTLPSAHYAIYGTEQYWGSLRYLESILQAGNSGNGSNTENGDAIRAWGSAAAVHLALAYRYDRKARNAYDDYIQTGNISYYYDYIDYLYVVDGFMIGFVSMVDWHHRRWDIVTGQIGSGAIAPSGVRVGGDALVATPSAAPNFISSTRRIRANGGSGANHTELVGPNGLNALRQAFAKPDVSVPEASSGGGGDDPTFPDPIIRPPCRDQGQILCPLVRSPKKSE